MIMYGENGVDLVLTHEVEICRSKIFLINKANIINRYLL